MKVFQSHRCFNWLSAAHRKVAVAVALTCLTAAATSCRSINEIVKEVPVHDTTHITKTQRDSTYIDRWRTEYIKGDTVFVTNNQITVKYRTVSDTVYRYVEKPVKMVVNQIKEVEKPLRWWQKNLIRCGVVFLIVIIVTVLAFCLSLRNSKRE